MVATAVTLNNLECHSPFADVFKCNPSNICAELLPERDYVTFGSLLSQFRLSSVVCVSSVCRLSVTLVHPTQAVERFGKLSSPLCTLAILGDTAIWARRV